MLRCGGILQNVAVYSNERDVFYREEADNSYSAETFMVQYTTLEVQFEIISSLIFDILAACADNLERSAQMFLICAYNCFCIINCSESVGNIVLHALLARRICRQHDLGPAVHLRDPWRSYEPER